MTLTVKEYLERFPDRPMPVPAEYAGQWIAWDSKRIHIIAHGTDMPTVYSDALAAGQTDPILQKVPHGPFVGSL
jgi:hypothetical protein